MLGTNDPFFVVNDRVELISSSYEDAGLFSGDYGTAIEVRRIDGHEDVLISWDSGADECWIDGKDLCL